MSSILLRGVVVSSVLAVAGLAVWQLQKPAAKPEKPKSEARLSSASPSMEQGHFTALAREVELLRARVDEADRSDPSDPHKEEVPEDSEELEEPASPPPLSDEEFRTSRVAYYSELLNSERRDPEAARSYETTLHDGFSQINHSTLKNVDCRSTLCRIEIEHLNGDARDNFDDFVLRSGPLKYGAFDYVEEGGEITIAFVGMPGHPLAPPKSQSD